MSLTSRINRLEANSKGTTALLFHWEGEPVPTAPPDAEHVIVVHIKVVDCRTPETEEYLASF